MFFFFVNRQVLEDMEMLSAFTAVLHVPNLSKPEHLINVLEESDVFTKKEINSIQKQIHGHKYDIFQFFFVDYITCIIFV